MRASSSVTSRLIDDCFRRDPRDGARLSHDDALAALRAVVAPVVGTEKVDLTNAAGRLAAERVNARQPVPGHTNAAVDGYAFASSAYDQSSGTDFPIAGRAAAGRPHRAPVPAGHAIRILTGAVVPQELDTVAMQEDCHISGDGAGVHVPKGLKPGANVRQAGEDVGIGDALVDIGQRLRPQDIAALASSGQDTLVCYKRVRVGVASTGDEVVTGAVTQQLEPGQVFDTNRPMLQALVTQIGGEMVDLGIWPDQRDVVSTRLLAAADTCDVILTSGGASQGEEDHISSVLAEIGSRHFWQIAVKPGRPLMLGQIDDTIAVGLPGNPVAVFVCFVMYVIPMLRRLGGGDWITPRRFPLPARFDVTDRKVGRREFWRGHTVETDTGLAVAKYPRDGSGLISGLRAADGLIDIPEDRGDVKHGEMVDFIPFTEFGL